MKLSYKHFAFLFFTNLVFIELTHALPRLETAEQENKRALKTEKQKNVWLLPSFLKLAQNNPRKLIGIGEKLFSEARVRISTIELKRAHEWQHRVAMVTALADVVVQSSERKKIAPIDVMRAKRLISQGLSKDPSLLVRDASAESLRRILKFSDRASQLSWKSKIEEGFLNEINVIEGEGLFIRETLLTLLRENNLKPHKKVLKAALEDKNTRVKAIAKTF